MSSIRSVLCRATAVRRACRPYRAVRVAALAALLALAPSSANAGAAVDFTMTKTPNPATFTAAGQVITYTYVITNNRSASPSSIFISLNDTEIGSIPITSCTGGEAMDPTFFGKTLTCTATYTITEGDVTAGSVSNMATFTGDSCRDGCNQSAVASATVTLGAAWTLVKSRNPATYSAAGQTISYSYVVTNTGGVMIGSITVTDDKVTPVNCPQSVLMPGASMTCTASYLTQPADLPNDIVNIATASGLPSSGTVANATSTATVTFAAQPSWTLAKTRNPMTYTAAGQTINYTYQLQNTGNVAISAITVTDNKVATVNCPASTLAVNATLTCTASYTTQAADLPNNIVNTATATGTPARGSLANATAQATVAFTGQAAMTLSKSANPTTYTGPGQTISYSYVVTNTGNVAIRSIAITDNKVATVTCPQTTLAPAASMTCTGAYATTAADVPNSIVNMATANAIWDGGALPAAAAQASVAFTPMPSWTLTASANPPVYNGAGQQITFTYVLTNTGNVTISSITVTDNAGVAEARAPALKQAQQVTCPSTALLPGQSMTCTHVYTTTAADVARGNLVINVQANGIPAAGVLPQANAQVVVQLAAGSVTLRKVALNGNGTFTFTGSLVTANAAFGSLTTTNGSASVGPMTLNPGTYAITESAIGGNNVSAISCTGDNNGTVDLTARTATINLDGGEAVVCTFFNGSAARPIPAMSKATLALLALTLLLVAFVALRRRAAPGIRIRRDH